MGKIRLYHFNWKTGKLNPNLKEDWEKIKSKLKNK